MIPFQKDLMLHVGTAPTRRYESSHVANNTCVGSSAVTDHLRLQILQNDTVTGRIVI